MDNTDKQAEPREAQFSSVHSHILYLNLAALTAGGFLLALSQRQESCFHFVFLQVVWPPRISCHLSLVQHLTYSSTCACSKALFYSRKHSSIQESTHSYLRPICFYSSTMVRCRCILKRVLNSFFNV